MNFGYLSVGVEYKNRVLFLYSGLAVISKFFKAYDRFGCSLPLTLALGIILVACSAYGAVNYVCRDKYRGA